MSKKQTKKSNQTNVFKLSTPATSPTEGEDSIAKVLEWFNRSTDSSDWLNGPASSSEKQDQQSKLKSEDTLRGEAADILSDLLGETADGNADVRTMADEELREREREDTKDKGQQSQVSPVTSFRERSKNGPKILIIKSVIPRNKEQKHPQLYVEEEKKSRSDMSPEMEVCFQEVSSKAKNQPLSGIGPHEDTVVDIISRSEVNNQQCQPLGSVHQTAVQSDGGKHHQTGEPVPPDAERSRMNKDVATSPESQQRKWSSREATTWDSDTSLESGMSPKRREARDRADASKGTAERIKQLRSFWEQERLYTGKSKPHGDGKVNGSNQAKLSKRFTKSEYDLRSLSIEDDVNFPGAPSNQRLEKMSPSLSASRSQFNTLRVFWDEASADKNKSPKKAESQNSQLSSEESKTSGSESYNHKVRAADSQSSPSLPGRGKPRAVQQREVKKISKELSREEKPVKLHHSPGKEMRFAKNRNDNFDTSSSRASSMRRAASMFMLSVPQDNGKSQAKLSKSPVPSPIRRQRQGADKASPKKTAEEAEPQSPLARACVPRDYRHYLGMTDQTCVHPSPEEKESEEKFEYDLDLDEPVRASTPVSSEDRYIRKSSKLSQRPPWGNYSSSDTGQDSCLSSPTNSRVNSRNASKST